MIVLCPRIIWPVHFYRLPARLRLPGIMSQGLFGPLFDRIQARNERATATRPTDSKRLLLRFVSKRHRQSLT